VRHRTLVPAFYRRTYTMCGPKNSSAPIPRPVLPCATSHITTTSRAERPAAAADRPRRPGRRGAPREAAARPAGRLDRLHPLAGLSSPPAAPPLGLSHHRALQRAEPCDGAGELQHSDSRMAIQQQRSRRATDTAGRWAGFIKAATTTKPGGCDDSQRADQRAAIAALQQAARRGELDSDELARRTADGWRCNTPATLGGRPAAGPDRPNGLTCGRSGTRC
jgi:hypothetical protein